MSPIRAGLTRLFENLYAKLLSNLGFALGLMALALLANMGALLAVNWANVHLAEAREQTIATRLALYDIQNIQSMLYEAESAQRGFLYTADTEYALPLRENSALIGSALAKLRLSLAGEPLQQRALDRIAKLSQEKLSHINVTVALQESGQAEAARAIVLTHRGKGLMAEIDAEIARFVAAESKTLERHLGVWENIQLGVRWGFVGILFLNAMMILAGSVVIIRGLARERAGLERESEGAVRESEGAVRESEGAERHDQREREFAAEAVWRAEELRALSAHLLTLQENERYTVARELHDELGGTLSAIKLDIIMAKEAAAKRNDEKSAARLQRAHTSIDGAVQFVRRLIEDLRPTLLDNLGFDAALRSMAEQFGDRCAVACAITLPEGELDLTPAQSIAMYRICQEALTNVMKYAKAKQVNISLANDGAQWTLVIADDGVGINADSTQPNRRFAHGLLGMRERVVALGGQFNINGSAGVGTTLTATFPIAPVGSIDA